jgi:tetratricopeptide (TPR) repeat protein
MTRPRRQLLGSSLVRTTVRVLAVGLAAVLIYSLLPEAPVSEQTLVDAKAELADRNKVEALRLVNRYLEVNPDSVDGIKVQGKAHLANRNIDEAYDCFARVLESEPDSLEAHQLCVQAATRLAKLSDVEMHLYEILRLDPDNDQAHEQLFDILRLEGRIEEVGPHFMAALKNERVRVADLLAIAAPEFHNINGQDYRLIDACKAAAPDDALPLLGIARQNLVSGNVAEALPVLKSVCKKYPSVLIANGWLGQALLLKGDVVALQEWDQQLPETWGLNSTIWLVQGEIAAKVGKPKQAARCYWEGLKRNAMDRICAFRLGNLLAKDEQYKSEAGRVLKYASDLASLIDTANEAGPESPQKLRVVVHELERLGRVWEAAGWASLSRQLPEATWAPQEWKRLSTEVLPGAPFICPEANIAHSIDLSDWPLPDDESISDLTQSAASGVEFSLQFVNQAADKGIDFRFEKGLTEQPKVFHFSGGGASVLDVDLDGWPDLYFTQGTTWPVTHAADSPRDQIFRNVGGDRFQNISDKSILGDTGYSQGAAIGDLDNDGFPDIFVGNIGANTLYHNNGDGTFTQMELDPQLASDQWTISAMIADLSGDGCPDIYAANYLMGDDLHDRICLNGARPIQCGPDLFPAAPDRFLKSNGDGSFHDASGSSGLVADEGKAMGVVAFRTRESGEVSVLVSNDMTPNHLYSGNAGRFREQGLVSGIALGAEGRRQSCMGIAAGDVDNDGRVDFFVTNYLKEANNLYMQLTAAAFDDTIDSSGMREAGYSHMGWGAQFLDANLDGNLDLMVANGHLEYRGRSRSKMPTQVFQNLGEGRFVPGEEESAAGYFAKKYYGRAIARFDWNRDGLPDAIITHRNAPVGLLTNTTVHHGDSVRITLIGVQSSRDAVGAVAVLETDSRTIVRQILAGDGFQASNQKQIVFGLRPDEAIKSLHVDWPSGQSTTLETIDRNVDHVLVEGTARALPSVR